MRWTVATWPRRIEPRRVGVPVPETDTKASAPVPAGAAQTKPLSGRAKWTSELISLAVVIAAVTGARSSLADHYRIESGSMEFSLMTHDRVVVNKMSYGIRIPLTTIDIFGSSTPERGDIALFDSPEDGTTADRCFEPPRPP
jgi:signal peptidase I